MSLKPPLPVGDHYKYFHGTQFVQYQSKVGNSFATAITVVGLKREDTKPLQQGNQGVQVARHLVLWSIWRESMSSPVIPKRGDILTATTISGSKAFIVEEVKYSDWTSRYKLYCYQQGNGA